jgi:hypothetical protein
MDLPSTFGVLPFGTNVALPEKDTTTESVGCAGTELLASQTVTRSLSMIGFDAGVAAWNSMAHSKKMAVMAAPFRNRAIIEEPPAIGNGKSCNANSP